MKDDKQVRLKIIVSYDGAGFFGWQRQNDKPTVQGEIENAFFKTIGKNISIVGSGRTDEGVHAIAQTAHADVNADILKKFDSFEKLALALNHYLSNKIVIKKISASKKDFHACTGAYQKTYVYDFYLGDKNPLLENRALFVSKKINIKAIQAACKEFIGSHDFVAFRAKGSTEVVSTVRQVLECKISSHTVYGSKVYRLTVTANGFLYKMVRIIMGTLLKVGINKMTASDIKNLLSAGKEWDKKTPAPPEGLYLLKVKY